MSGQERAAAAGEAAAPAADQGWPLGLLRALDRDAQCHRYGAGSIPPGELTGELGSCRSASFEGSVPLWLVDTGRYAVTPEYRPAPRRPGLRQAARWALAPATWRGLEPVRDRVRSVRARAAEARRRLRAGRRPVVGPMGRPAGFIRHVPGEEAIALFAGIHPVTGDQLLTRDEWELVHLGYVDIALLGFLDPVAPLTGRVWDRRPRLAWASRYGAEDRSGADPAAEGPAGAMLIPNPDQPRISLPFLIMGWAVAPAGVSAVEVTVDGVSVGHARVGMDHLELIDRNPLPDAPVSRFEFRLLPAHVAPGAREVAIGCSICDMDGGRLDLAALAVELWDQEPPDAGDYEARAAELRRRGPARPRAGPSPGGKAVNLLVFTHDLGLGGAQLYLLELLERLVRLLDLTATVVAPDDGPLCARLESLGMPVHVTAGYPYSGVDAYEGRVAELLAWAGPQGFDLAFVNTMPAFAGADVAGRLRIPSVVAIHESYELDDFWVAHFPGGGHPYVRERGRHVLAHAEAVVFVAEATRRHWLDHGEADRFLTLPYGIEFGDIDRFRAGLDRLAVRRSLQIADREQAVLCLGTIEPRKAQAVLAKAFAHVAGDHPDSLLLLVGRRPGDRYAAAIEEYARRVGLRGRIRTIPLDPEPYKWHGAADVLVCASDVESLPRVVPEGMAFEVPVLATDVFGLGELIEDGETGYLCQPRDVQSLARGLERVLGAGPEELASVAKAGSVRARSRHDPEAYAETVARLMTGLLRRPEVAPRDLVSA